VHTLACHQLTPELAERLAGVDLVVFIDAAAGVEPGSVMTSELTAAATVSPLAHSVDPRALLAMAGDLFGRSPRAFLVEVGAASFEYGEALSPVVAAALPNVIAAIRHLLSSALNPIPSRPRRSAGSPLDTAPSHGSSSSDMGHTREAPPAPD
jgi:hydrogenase maturation protease